MTSTITDFIDSRTSVAWLQTRFGHMGFGTSNFWKDPPSKEGDPNLVKLDDKTVPVKRLDYSPPGQSNADFFVMSPDGNDIMTSRMGEKGKIAIGNADRVFTKDGKLLHGEPYDRKNNPRDFMDDLLNREFFGKVVRVNYLGADKLMPLGLVKVSEGNYRTENWLKLAPDTVYHIKGKLTIGNPDNADIIDADTKVITRPSVTISGGKARLMVEGNIDIVDNVKYKEKSPHPISGMVNIPSVRAHATDTIRISPNVTAIELMMLAEKEFHSGRSTKQLRILGDVITYTAYWEREPLKGPRGEEEPINKPSELIYEDMRKYLLTPPGDQKLWDIQNVWREVSPGTGVPKLQKIYDLLDKIDLEARKKEAREKK